MIAQDTLTIEFYASPAGICKLAAAALVGISLSSLVIVDREAPIFVWLCSWVGLASCVLVVQILIWRIVNIKQPIVTLSPRGFFDSRISYDFLPWHSVKNIRMKDVGSSYSYRAHPIVIITFDEMAARTHSLTRAARGTLSINRILGWEGLAVPSVEFNVKAEDFFSTLRNYARTHGGKVD
jgi:hypothetical protein